MYSLRTQASSSRASNATQSSRVITAPTSLATRRDKDAEPTWYRDRPFPHCRPFRDVDQFVVRSSAYVGAATWLAARRDPSRVPPPRAMRSPELKGLETGRRIKRITKL